MSRLDVRLGFLRARSGAQVKLRIREVERLERNMSTLAVKILKEYVNFFTEYICIFYKNVITTSKFPFFLKMAKRNSYFQERMKNKKENFKPICILPVLSKSFEKLMSKQLSTFFENLNVD